MRILRRVPGLERFDHRELTRLAGLMGLFFLVVCAVGMLRPVKNALALDGLGATEFYKVYLVSAVVVLFVPLYNRLAARFAWRVLIPAVAFSFALQLLLFRAFYVEGSTLFGLMFYGWYDLFAAALVTQFFMAAQMFLDARSAKSVYPLVIAGGSIGATMGGGVTGIFSERLGTPNLLLVAAVLIAIFALLLPLVWGAEPPKRNRREQLDLGVGELRRLLGNRQVRLIAGAVLLTIIVKELVDYQFNTLSKEVFQTRDAISAFQGRFNAITQWLPALFIIPLHPLLRRWGVGLALMLLPAAMLLTGFGVVLWWGLGSLIAAKGAETGLRYSTERAAREILYVPIPEEIKLEAKAWIDVAVEKGLGKFVSAGLIFLLLQVMEYRQIAWVTIALSLVWLWSAHRMRQEYVRTLARSIEGRFASLRGAFASLADPGTLAAVRRALAAPDAVQIAFALDLVSQAGPIEVRTLAPELHRLLDRPEPELQARALELLARVPDAVDADRVRAELESSDHQVREAAVRALYCAAADPGGLIRELLNAKSPAVRTATLGALASANGRMPQIEPEFIDQQRAAAQMGDEEGKLEFALALGVARPEGALDELRPLARDPNPRVARAVIRSAGALPGSAAIALLIDALGRPVTRAPAREALVARGRAAEPALIAALLNEQVPVNVRRNIPAVLARIPYPEVATALLEAILAPETDQLLDDRALLALVKLRSRQMQLPFDRTLVMAALRREVTSALIYQQAESTLKALPGPTGLTTLFATTLHQAAADRRAGAFKLLALLYPPDQIAACQSAIATGDRSRSTNAAEWLEQSVSRDIYQVMQPILDSHVRDAEDRTAVLERLRGDNDRWIALLADRLSRLESGSPKTSETMDLIEKVFLLQRVDLLHEARSAHLALLASVAAVAELPPGRTVLDQNGENRAMYVVIDGTIRLTDQAGATMQAGPGEAIGTWALIDDQPALVNAVTETPTRLLRIERDDFRDLLNDNPELAVGLLQGLARRIRNVVAG